MILQWGPPNPIAETADSKVGEKENNSDVQCIWIAMEIEPYKIIIWKCGFSLLVSNLFLQSDIEHFRVKVFLMSKNVGLKEQGKLNCGASVSLTHISFMICLLVMLHAIHHIPLDISLHPLSTVP